MSSLAKKPRPRRSYRHVPEGFHFLLEGSPHPLLIPGVVNHVASYLKFSDLKPFRQVCSLWNEEACKHFRHKAKVVLNGEENVVAYTKLFNSPTSTAQAFHTSFELQGDIELGSFSVQRFFDLFGEKIKYMCFSRVKWKQTELRDLLFEKLPDLEELGFEVRACSDPQLFSVGDDPGQAGGEALQPRDHSGAVLAKVRVLRLNGPSRPEETKPFLRDLLHASPNVEVISSLKTSTMSNPLPMPFIQYICQAMNYGTADDLVNLPCASSVAIADAILETKCSKLSKLATLGVNMRLRTQGLDQLALKGYPLRQLDLTVMSDVTSCTLQKMLSSVRNTLKILKLKFQPGGPVPIEFVTPELSKLESLSLNGYKNSLKFLEHLPNLKVLILIRINLQRALAMEPVQCRKPFVIESFQVFEEFSMGGLACDTIRLLALLFPQVKELKLENLCDGSLVEVFEEFPLLEDLNALNGFYTDAGVTGIKKHLLEASHNSLETVEYAELKEKPDISCLKNLRSLSLGSPKITDHSILHGVLLCKGLRRLHLISYGITDISLLRLCDELDLCTLKTEFCFQFTQDTVNYVKETMKMKGRTTSLNEYTGPMKQSEIPKFMRRNRSVSVRLHKLDVANYCPPSPPCPLPDLPLVPPSVNDMAQDEDLSAPS